MSDERAENSALPWCVDTVGSLVPADFGHDTCLVSSVISIGLIQSCLIVSSNTTENIRVGSYAKIAEQ